MSKAIEQMNRIDQLFSSPKRDLLSVYFCAGHPALDSTVPTLESLQAHGADLVEIGIPFSDPMADGPVIQSASTKALRNGMTLRLLFRQLEGVRERGITLPLLTAAAVICLCLLLIPSKGKGNDPAVAASPSALPGL